MRLVLAEDLALLRIGLTQLLEARGFMILHSVTDEPELEAALRDPDADAAMVDVRLPPSFTDEGLRAALAVRARRPRFPVLVLSQYVERLYAREVLASAEGAVGYLLKDRVSDVDDFFAALHQVVAGGTVLDPEVVAQLMSSRGIPPVDRLTARVKEVLELMGEGRSTAAIGARLFVTEKAVAKHINAIFTKLDLSLDGDDHRRVLAVLAWLKV